MRILWTLKPPASDPATFKSARYGIAIDEDEQRTSFTYIIVRHDHSSRPYHLYVRGYGHTLAVLTGFATLEAAKAAALIDAEARWDRERAA